VEAINRGLEASGVFVLLLTPEAVASRWVNSETNVAIEMEHEGLLKFIPLQIRPCGVPALWRAYQRIPFRGGYDTGWQALRHRLNPAAAPSPLPPIEMWPRQPEPPLPSPNPFIHEKSGLEFIRILAGDFLYGKEKETVYLPEYWISKTPVTQAQYQRFITANPEYDVPYYDADWAKPYNWDRENRTFPQDKADHPVVLVSWHDAMAFCEWAGARLPTEEEWEKAVRGTDGREYPWGNKWREKHCNSREAEIGGTSRVGQFSPQGDSLFGCVDMSGNVWEWTDSWYDEKQSGRGLRGGSWYYLQNFARAADRFNAPPDSRGDRGGFRVVWVRRSPSQDH
jgi:hypothetical protein